MIQRVASIPKVPHEKKKLRDFNAKYGVKMFSN